jgi:hypothetical protein
LGAVFALTIVGPSQGICILDIMADPVVAAAAATAVAAAVAAAAAEPAPETALWTDAPRPFENAYCEPCKAKGDTVYGDVRRYRVDLCVFHYGRPKKTRTLYIFDPDGFENLQAGRACGHCIERFQKGGVAAGVPICCVQVVHEDQWEWVEPCDCVDVCVCGCPIPGRWLPKPAAIADARKSTGGKAPRKAARARVAGKAPRRQLATKAARARAAG